MSLSDTSIKNPVFAWMLLIGVVVFGMTAFTRLGVSQLPDVDFPVVSVSASWEGASPEVMESEVTDVIEGAVMGIQGVQEIVSTSRQGQSSVTVEFALGRDIDVALQEIQSSIARVQRSLPRDMDPAVIRKSNPEDQPILWLGLSGDRSLTFLMSYTRDYLQDRLTTVPGVGDVMLGGYVEPNLRVWLDADRLSRHEMTVDDITAAIALEHAEVPAGYIETPVVEKNVRVTGEAASVAEFSSMIIPARKGAPLWKTIRIGDVATVEDGLAPVRRISRTMGVPAVGLGIRKQRGTNAVEVAHAVKERVADLQKNLPEGLKLEVRFDMTAFVEESIKDMQFVMLLSVILTSLVCWLFLGSFSSAANIFLTIPLSICGTFFCLYVLGFTLNTFTLLGLSLVIGIVVDDAIMMLENIARHREAGESRVRAAILGAREITFAAVAASVAILAIFVPVIFMEGVIGRYFLQFGVTISIAVMISLVGALTLTPMISAQFLNIGHTSRLGRATDAFMHWLKQRYAAALAVCLCWRWGVVIISLAVFAGSLFLFGAIKKEFVPPQDQGRLMIRIETPTGTALEKTDVAARAFEKILQGHPAISSVFTNVGGDLVNTASFMITLRERSERPLDVATGRPLTQQGLIPILRRELRRVPGVSKVVVTDPSLTGFTARRGSPVEFTVTGPDWATLASLSGRLEEALESSGLMVDVDSDYEMGAPEIRVVPDRAKAAARGVSVSVIGDAINAMVGGVRAGKYTRDGRRYDVRVQLVAADRSRVQDIGRIFVRNNRGEIIRLSEVVSIVEQPSLMSITRKNRERAIRMYANLAPGAAQGDALRAAEELGRKQLPDGYHLNFSGAAQTFRSSFTSLYIALIFGVFVAYMVLGTQFNSFVHPLTVLLALPFSVSGAAAALLLTGQSLNIYSAIGLILLMGIVKKNSILLVDFTNQRRAAGMNVHDALMDACPVRLRPILMTSLATIAAAVPPALAIGPGAESRVPMAVVVIGGVVVSTLLTLLVVPCVYSLLAGLESTRHTAEVRAALEEFSKA